MSANLGRAEGDIFMEAFDGMFNDLDGSTAYVETSVADPGPPVPIDSSILALMIAGIVLGLYYTQRRVRREGNA